MAAVLVTGGAGFLGSHMVRALLDAGHEPVVLDDLETGHADAIGPAELLEVDLRDREAVDRALTGRSFEAVFHFAGRIQVGESVVDPLGYYGSNVAGTLHLLEAAGRAGVGSFIFSSSAAVYGQPETVPIPEDAPARPINPYGWSKWMVERVLEDAARVGRLRYAALRYFNAAGCALDGSLGERHDPETHLVPLVLSAARTGEPIAIHGDDYPTPDGTCVRDYVHVVDLCEAHLLAWRRLEAGGPGGPFNLGTGRGLSVLEIVAAARDVTGRDVPVRIGPRRPGDAATLVADAGRARRELGWTPRHSDVRTLLESAWNWFRDRT